MTAPTKVNVGNNRVSRSPLVLNAEDRGVERQQLNLILKSINERLLALEAVPAPVVTETPVVTEQTETTTTTSSSSTTVVMTPNPDYTSSFLLGGM